MDLFCRSGEVEAVPDGRRPRNCCRRLAVKRIWETIAERKEEEEERIARHKDEVFSTWLNCKPIGEENVRFK